MTDSSDPLPGVEGVPWRPELTETIYALLYRDDVGLDLLVTELEELARAEGDMVYSELLYLLSHIRFQDE